MVSKQILPLLVGLLFVQCTTSASVMEQIRPRAVFDLNCPANQIQVVEIAGGGAGVGTYGAIGCGQRVRYETVCSFDGSQCSIKVATAANSPKPTE
ncbi:hypothetical protein AKJ09_01018 [Labilithrix luteola]|uniref:Lipoprotein n=1 Tax=Labilithrix luteola TaxID=1391654 RepID=A0A0K1PML3_9BACT|nr:hypothetical protein [Labilithrix luteola]AKU94354.1 hypothetical protein AKJ09_01018 [Labilithrix luteola]